mmetsp:Transcript_410/g.1398  ORF Transcript_410/g.1398 Transcript_410/m.1398 type:complete len:485 (+) Transcript_410:105-1559(+)
MGVQARSVQVYELASSRVREMQMMYEPLRKRARGGSGNLSWHMRRRNRSHMRRIRRSGTYVGGVSTSAGPLSRRSRRQRKRYWMQRAERRTCLETHKWHSKRFVMTKFDDKTWIAQKSMDRGLRSAVRCAQTHAVLCDISWLDVFAFTGNNRCVVALGSSFSPHMDKLHPEKQYLWSHPHARYDVTSSQRVRMLRFRIIGPKSRELLNKALKICVGPQLAPSHHQVNGSDTPVLIVPQPAMLTGGFGSGFDVVLSGSHGMEVWMKLIVNGMRAIGSTELRQIYLEGAQVVFSADGSVCKAPKRQIARTSKKPRHIGQDEAVLIDPIEITGISKFTSRSTPTLQKRWQAAIATTSTVANTAVFHVQLRFGSRGVPKDGATIILPTESDTTQYTKLKSNFRGRRPLKEDVIIGKVTTGGFSFLRGQGYASGAWIRAQMAHLLLTDIARIRELRLGCEALVLVRNPEAEYLYTAFASVPMPNRQRPF